MSIFVGQLVFNGPFLSHNEIREEEGVYVILSQESGTEENAPLEFGVTKLGHSNNLKAELLENGLTGSDMDFSPSHNLIGRQNTFAAVIYAHERPDITVETVVSILRQAA